MPEAIIGLRINPQERRYIRIIGKMMAEEDGRQPTQSQIIRRALRMVAEQTGKAKK